MAASALTQELLPPEEALASVLSLMEPKTKPALRWRARPHDFLAVEDSAVLWRANGLLAVSISSRTDDGNRRLDWSPAVRGTASSTTAFKAPAMACP